MSTEVDADRTHDDAVVADSVAGSFWTGVSRATGVARAAVIGAVLGATYLGNTYQALNSLPNLVYYQLLAGSLFASVLVPVLVRHLDAGSSAHARDLVNGFLGMLLLFAGVAAVLLVLGGRVIIQLMGASVSDAETAASQRHVGWLLLVLFVPQIALYLVAGVGTAAMNSHRRFAVAAAAPAVENLGIIAVMIVAVLAFGDSSSIVHVTDDQILLIGLGTTLAVGLHASVQWWGARRCGFVMVPHRGWNDAEARMVVRRLVPALGFTGLVSLQLIATLLVANRVAGGVVAFQLALNFYYLPLALVAWPIARAMMPQLATATSERRSSFRDQLRRALRLASFAVIPLAVVYIAFASKLSNAVSFGNLEGTGAHLVALSLVALAPGVIAETWFILGTSASYAREDVTTPLVPMALRVAVSLVLMAVAVVVRGHATLPILGLSMSLGSLAGALYLARRVRAQCGADSRVVGSRAWSARALPQSIIRTTLLALAAAVPAWLGAFAATRVLHGRAGDLASLATGLAVFCAVFLGMNARSGSYELSLLQGSLPWTRSKRSTPRVRHHDRSPADTTSEPRSAS